jgi:quercetin dioxygenase-like cupin family protein
MANPRPPNEGQLSSDLPGVTHYITGHDSSTSKAIVQSTRPGSWVPFLKGANGFDVVYTTSEFPASLNDDKDLKAHDELMSSKKLGLVSPNGTVCRIVDFAPGAEPLMHRTQSLDYGVVLEGTMEMSLDSGEISLLHRGDVAVQRATMHGWWNSSKTDWARMLFVLQDCQPVVIDGKSLGEDLSHAKAAGENIPASRSEAV